MKIKSIKLLFLLSGIILIHDQIRSSFASSQSSYSIPAQTPPPISPSHPGYWFAEDGKLLIPKPFLLPPLNSPGPDGPKESFPAGVVPTGYPFALPRFDGNGRRVTGWTFDNQGRFFAIYPSQTQTQGYANNTISSALVATIPGLAPGMQLQGA